MRFVNRIVAMVAATSLCLSQVASAADPQFLGALGGTGNTLAEVEVNKGRPLRLPAAAASVAIANPQIADVQVVSPRLLFINGRGVGETSLIAVDARDNVIIEGDIVVTHNLSRLKKAAKGIAPQNDIVAGSSDNAIILEGKIDSPVQAEKLQRLASSFLVGENQQVINMMDTSQSDQVMLKVKIVELARSELKRFGINWESVINAGNFVFGLARGRDAVNSVGQLIRSADGDNSVLAGWRNGNLSVNAVIDALENDGLVSVLAEPTLTTRSGQQASFLAGGEYPIPVPGNDGVVTIQYRQFGVSLQFTPVVLSKDKISLTVLPEVSALSQQNAITGGDFGTIPSLTTRRASTTVDLGTGQTFAIAGLLRSDVNSNNSKVPLLGDVPIVGSLFQTTEYGNDQTELVILVTPYIVKPVDNEKQLATPLDGYTPPTDGERILLGRLHGESAKLADSERSDAQPTQPEARVESVSETPITTAEPAKPAVISDQDFIGQAGFVMR